MTIENKKAVEAPHIIELYGPPGAGKSLAMHGLVYEMKKMGLRVENTPEFVKDLVYDGIKIDKLGGQLYILSEQNHRIARVMDSVDFIITDCPLPLIGSYTPPNYIRGFEEMLHNLHKTYKNVGYFINRNPEYEFENEGRYHDMEASDKKAVEIKEYLEKHKIKTTNFVAGDNLIGTIIEDLMEKNVISLEHLKKSRTPSIRKKYKR